MERADDPNVEAPAAMESTDRRADLRVTSPALEASQQPGFKVVEEAPKRRPGRMVWTALVVVILIAAAYALGYFR